MVTRFSLSASISSTPIDACHSSSLPNSRIQNPQPVSSSADNPHCALLFPHDVISQEEAIEVAPSSFCHYLDHAGPKAACQTCLSCLTVAMSTGSRNDIGKDSE